MVNALRKLKLGGTTQAVKRMLCNDLAKVFGLDDRNEFYKACIGPNTVPMLACGGTKQPTLPSMI